MSKKKSIIKPEVEVNDSSYIKPKLKKYLFCWDFDNTIIKGNSYDFFDSMNITGKVPEELIDKFLADPATGLKNPLKLLSTIRRILKHDHKIAITTLSDYPEIIEPALQKLGLSKEEINKVKIIAGPSSTIYPGKLKHIKKAMDHFEITTEQSVYLIDDNEENCSLAEKNGYCAIKVETKESREYLTKINELITIKSTTDESTPDKVSDKGLKVYEVPKVYRYTEKVEDFSFFLTPQSSSFKAKPLKNSSLRKKLCFGQEEGLISSKLLTEDILTGSMYFPSSLTLPLKENPVEILGEKFNPSPSESSD